MKNTLTVDPFNKIWSSVNLQETILECRLNVNNNNINNLPLITRQEILQLRDWLDTGLPEQRK